MFLAMAFKTRKGIKSHRAGKDRKMSESVHPRNSMTTEAQGKKSGGEGTKEVGAKKSVLCLYQQNSFLKKGSRKIGKDMMTVKKMSDIRTRTAMIIANLVAGTEIHETRKEKVFQIMNGGKIGVIVGMVIEAVLEI